MPPRRTLNELATVAGNEAPSSRKIDRAIELGAEIVAAVNDREAIISSARLDRAFCLPDANWSATAQNDYCAAYRLLTSLEWDQLRFLRLRTQMFTGNSLVHMRPMPGSSAVAPVPPDFERDWPSDVMCCLAAHWRFMTRDMPSRFVFKPANMLGESGWWVDGVIVNPDTVHMQERVTLVWHAGIAGQLPRKPRILEIGGGYGALASALITAFDPSLYAICDLPESLLFSGLYLALTRERPHLAKPHEPLDRSRSRVILLPNYLFPSAISGEHFDLVVNTLSMSEMSVHQVQTYGALISRAIGTHGVFFEQNHDNKQLGMIYSKDHLAPSFSRRRTIAPDGLPVTRGQTDLWSNAQA